MPQSHQTVEIHAIPAEEVKDSIIHPDVGMMIMTWVVFFLLLAILYKFAWKPILKALDEREASIRKSLNNVDRINKEMEQLNQKCSELIREAEEKGSAIIEQSRSASRDAAQLIEDKAREEAKISLENALREIREETQKAQMRLREESADLAVRLAGKIIEENMDTGKNRTLINRFIKDI